MSSPVFYSYNLCQILAIVKRNLAFFSFLYYHLRVSDLIRNWLSFIQITENEGNPKMKKIDVSSFLPVWDEILRLERETDHGLCKRLHLTPSAVSHWRTGITRRIHPRVIRMIELALGYKLSWNDGAGKWEIAQMPTMERRKEETVRAEEPTVRSYPVVERVTQGRDGYTFESSGNEPAPPDTNFEKAYWFEIKDSSMMPRFSLGDRVLVVPDVQPQNGQFAVVVWKGDAIPTARRVFIRGEHIALVPLNPAVDVIPLGRSEIIFWGTILYTLYKMRG